MKRYLPLGEHLLCQFVPDRGPEARVVLLSDADEEMKCLVRAVGPDVQGLEPNDEIIIRKTMTLVPVGEQKDRLFFVDKQFVIGKVVPA